jgi:O-antigen/teichoic acid export membrane protein
VGVIASQSLRTAVLSYIGIALGYVNVVLLFPRFFTAEEFGLTRVLISVAAVSAQFALVGTVNTIIRFVPRWRTEADGHHGLLGLSLLISLVGTLVVAGVLWGGRDVIVSWYADRSALFGQHYAILIPLLLSETLIQIFQAYARALLSTVVNALLKDVALRLFTVCTVLAYRFLGLSFEVFLTLFVLQYGVLALLQLAHVARMEGLRLRPRWTSLHPDLRTDMARYALFTLTIGASGILMINIDVIMVGALAGLDSTAFYAVAFYMTALVNVPANAIMGIAVPVLADAWSRNDTALVQKVYSKTSINQLVAGGLVAAGLWANEVNLFAMLPESYADGRWVLLIVLIAKLIDVGFGVNGGVIHTSPHYRADMFFNLGLIGVAVLSNWFLIPQYGLAGAATATLISLFLFNMSRFLYIRALYGMVPFSLATLWAVALIAAVAALGHIMPPMGSWALDVVIRSAVVLILYVPVVLWLRLSEDINAFVGRLIGKSI